MTKDCPYVGLNYFLEADADYFFGREVESRRVIGNLLATRLTLLYAQSGVGKSSLLRAGAAATLRAAAQSTFEEDGAPDFVPVVFSAWHGDVERSLADAIAAAAQPFAGETAVREETFEATLARSVEVVDAPLLLILDQFEEFFLYHGADEEGAKFADALARCVLDPDLRANFLLSIREDAYASIGEHFKARIPNVYGNFLYLEYLDEEAARAAIFKPVEQHNRSNGTRFQIEPALVDDVLDGIRRKGAARYESAYLQLVMEEIWRLETASNSATLRQTTLLVRGGAPEIIRSQLMRAIDELSPEETTLAANAFRHLVTSSGTKIALTAGELAELAELDQAELEPVLAHLVRARTLREVERGEHGVRYELFHDRLGPPVVEWRREHLMRIREERRYVEERREAELKEARLHKLLETEQVRGVRRTRIAFFVVSALFVAALLVAVLAVQQRRTAIDQANIARSRALAADSAGLLAIDPERSLVAARRAAMLDETAEAAAALRNALSASRVRARLQLGRVEQASLTADGRLLVTTAGRRASLWRTRDGRRLTTATFQDPVDSVALATHGETAVIAAGAMVSAIGANAGRLPTTRSPIESVSIDSGGTRVAVATSDQRVSVWDLPTRRLVRRSERPGPVVFDPSDARILVTTDCRRPPTRLGVRGVSTLPGVTEIPGCRLSVSPDGQHAVNYDARGFVRLSDVPRRDPITSSVDTVDLVSAVAWSPDGRRVAIAAGTGATVLDANTGVTLFRLAGHSDVISSVAFSASGDELVTTSRDGTARTWEARNGKQLVMLLGHKSDVIQAAFLPGDELVQTVSTDGTTRRWQIEQGDVLRERSRVLGVAFAPDGRRVASASRRGTARLWDLRTHAWTRVRVPGPRAHVLNSVAFDPSGRQVVIAGENDLQQGLLFIADAATGRPVLRFLGRGSAFTSARFSPDGRQVVATASAPGVFVYDTRTGATVMRASLSSASVITSAEFTPDGGEILAASDDGSALLIDAQSGVPLRRYRPAQGALAGATMSPDGRRILMFGSNAVAQIVDAEGRLLARLTGHTAPVTSGAFNPDGATVVTASADRTTRVWDARSGVLLSTQAYHGDGVNSVVYSPDGRTIASGSDDWTVRLYPCATCGSLDHLLALARVRTP